MILIGLTGGIACGKSTASTILSKEYGFRIIDADSIVHELQKPGAPCTRRIAEVWPLCVDATTGELHRAELGRIISMDPSARKKLGKIMNGPILFTILKRIFQCWWEDVRRRGPADKPCIVVLDAPTLFETKVLTFFISNSLVVSCSEETQITRMMARNGIARELAAAKIGMQMPLERKRQLAGRVIENDGNLDVLRGAISESVEWMEIQSSRRLSLIVGGVVGTVVGALSIVVLGLVRLLKA